MMSVIIRDKEGDPISITSDTRALRKRITHVCGAKFVHIERIGKKGKLSILFTDDCSCEMNWASYEVLLLKLKTWRSLYGTQLIICGTAVGELSYDNEALNRRIDESKTN